MNNLASVFSANVLIDGSCRKSEVRSALPPAAARTLFVIVIAGGALAGLLATNPGVSAAAVAQAGADLTRLLRGMAVLKAGMALALAAAVFWRLGSPATWLWTVCYAVAGAAMATGPALIWDMAHVRLGALLLHGGLLVGLILLWRDPQVGARLATMIAGRRSALRDR